MKFPVVIIKKGQSPIYFFRENNFGLISKGGEKFYYNGIIYDSAGNVFLITEIESVQKASVLKSVRYFQLMYQENIKYKKLNSVSLLEFKKLIIDHISSYRKYWLSRDTFEGLKKSIEEKNSFSEIIIFLK